MAPHRHGTGGHLDVTVEDGWIVRVGGEADQLCRGAVEAGHDLVVRGLAEVSVPHPDAEERLGCLDADQLVGGAGEVVGPPRRGDRDSQDHTGGALGAGHLAGGACRRASCDPVVHDDDGPSLERDSRPAPTESFGSAGQLGPFAPLDVGDLRFRHARGCR